MTSKGFPVPASATPNELFKVMLEMVRIRDEDVSEFDNLINVFVRGRKVEKVPVDSTDVEDTDRVGDFNFDADYIYLCVDDTGAAWRRVALATW